MERTIKTMENSGKPKKNSGKRYLIKPGKNKKKKKIWKLWNTRRKKRTLKNFEKWCKGVKNG